MVYKFIVHFTANWLLQVTSLQLIVATWKSLTKLLHFAHLFNQSVSLLSQSVSNYTFLYTVYTYMYKKNMLQHYFAFLVLFSIMDCDIVI